MLISMEKMGKFYTGTKFYSVLLKGYFGDKQVDVERKMMYKGISNWIVQHGLDSYV
jgi:hypothetical protein